MYAGIAVLGLGMMLGGIIANIIFFGLLTAASFILLVETASNSFKMVIGRFGFLIDFILYVLSCLAVATLGVTVAGGLGIASLVFTLYRINFLSKWYDANKPAKQDSVFSKLCRRFNTWYSGIKSKDKVVLS